MIRERLLAGIARARSKGRALGRKRLEETNAAKVSTIRTARAKGLGLRRIATDLHVGVGTAGAWRGETSRGDGPMSGHGREPGSVRSLLRAPNALANRRGNERAACGPDFAAHAGCDG